MPRYTVDNVNDLSKNIVEDMIFPSIYGYNEFARFSIEDMENFKNILIEKISIAFSSYLVDLSKLTFIYGTGLNLNVNVSSDKKEMEEWTRKINSHVIGTLKDNIAINKKVNVDLTLIARKEGLFRRKNGLHINILIT